MNTNTTEPVPQDSWDKVSDVDKVLILANFSSVDQSYLVEDLELMRRIKNRSHTFEELLQYINENF